MRMMSHDPGTSNYGYAIVEGVKRKGDGVLQFRVLENGLAPVTIKNLKDHKERRKQIVAYQEWCAALIEKYDVEALFGERYMTRGISGPTIESVNMMLGVLQCFGLPDVFIPAATWKNAVTRCGIELKEEYRYCRTTPHQLDASLIGVYGLHHVYGFKGFGDRFGQRTFDKLVTQVEDTSTARLFNRKLSK